MITEQSVLNLCTHCSSVTAVPLLSNQAQQVLLRHESAVTDSSQLTADVRLSAASTERDVLTAGPSGLTVYSTIISTNRRPLSLIHEKLL